MICVGLLFLCASHVFAQSTQLKPSGRLILVRVRVEVEENKFKQYFHFIDILYLKGQGKIYCDAVWQDHVYRADFWYQKEWDLITFSGGVLLKDQAVRHNYSGALMSGEFFANESVNVQLDNSKPIAHQIILRTILFSEAIQLGAVLQSTATSMTCIKTSS